MEAALFAWLLASIIASGAAVLQFVDAILSARFLVKLRRRFLIEERRSQLLLNRTEQDSEPTSVDQESVVL